MAKSGYCPDGVFRSLRPPLAIPTDPNTSMIPFLFRNVSSYPNKPALIDSDSGETLTFSELKTAVAKFSHALNNLLDITKNDVVLIFAPNSIEYSICAYSIIALGAIVTTADPHISSGDLCKQIVDSHPKLIITVEELYSHFVQFGFPLVFLGSKSLRNGIFSYQDLISLYESVSELPNVSIQRDDKAAILYTSGATGDSKGVVLSHKNFIVTSQMVTSDQRLMGEKDYVHLCFLPMFHVFAFAIILYSQLQEGNTIVSMGKFSFLGVLKSIEKYKVTHLWAVPDVIIFLTKQTLGKRFTTSLKLIISSGAPLWELLINEFAKKFPDVSILQVYGMTETTAAISFESPIVGHRHYGSSGGLLPGMEARIVSVHTNERKFLPHTCYGEIWVRGDSMMHGYTNNPEATGLTIDEHGFLHTGDFGHIDDEGQLHVISRVSELIKSNKGFKCTPLELEARLIAHEEILDAGIIGIPDDEAGEVPIAFVVRVPNCFLTEEDVKKFIADQVAPHFELRRVIFVKSIPKSASGNIRRRVLLEEFRSKK